MRCTISSPRAVYLALLPGLFLGSSIATADSPSSIPVREVTVFKDGHAFVLREGDQPVNSSGDVVLDELPAPVLGTFWPYSGEEDAKLSAVVAGHREVVEERTTLHLQELLEANVGSHVIVTETGDQRYGATIVGIPHDASEAEPRPRGAGPPATKGSVVLFQTDGGVKVVNLNRIQDVTFSGSYETSYKKPVSKNLLTLKLDWAEAEHGDSARVGLAYIQKGLRWIPNYRVTLDDDGNAHIELQATLINDLVDLEDTTMHLVIGVPTVAFKDTLDPISLQETMAQLSRYFQAGSQTQIALSNAITTQTARMGEYRARRPAESAPEPGDRVSEAGKNEDLFVFSVRGISLKKGERMVLPVVDYKVKYRDVFTLDLPFAPPMEFQRNLNTQQQMELARLFRAPKVMRKIRLDNKSAFPFTTAPALIVKNRRVLAQGMMTYTAINGTTDLPVTPAIDIRVKKSDSETKRTPNAIKWNGSSYSRVDLSGKIDLTNYLGKTAEIEVTRYVMGTADSADSDGKIRQATVFGEDDWLGDPLPTWWQWRNWPSGWHHLNGIARIHWTFQLEAGKSVSLGYAWHYFWL